MNNGSLLQDNLVSSPTALNANSKYISFHTNFIIHPFVRLCEKVVQDPSQSNSFLPLFLSEPDFI